ncbi:putative transcription factor B3-Domain family [Helianthus annuus]|nr:putative transcription factor B3-Domain family [Helianthus annuus]
MRSHRKLRNFYRFITSDTDQTCLKIPKKFTRDHRKQILLNNNVLIIVSDDKYVPVRFYRRYLSSKKKGVRCVLQMAQGGSWGGVKCRVYEGYAKLCGQNWKRFSDENHLCVGDVCVFELINAVEKVMRVTISRAC